MKKPLLLLIAVLLTCSVFAREMSLWVRLQTPYRRILPAAGLPSQLFAVKSLVAKASAEQSKAQNDDSKIQTAIKKLQSLPVTGLIWSNDPQQRRVLIGDVVLSKGQAVPSYVFNDGLFYTLTDISQSTLSFTMQEGAFGVPEKFDIYFELTEPVKNTSRYSDAAKKK